MNKSLKLFIFLVIIRFMFFPPLAKGEPFSPPPRVNLSVTAGPTILIAKGIWGDYLPNINFSLRANYRLYQRLSVGMEFLFLAGGSVGFILPHVKWEFYKGIYAFIGGGFGFMEDMEAFGLHFLRGPQIGVGWRFFPNGSNLFLLIEYNVVMDLHKVERKKDFFGDTLDEPMVNKYHFISNQFIVGLGYAF